MPHVRVLFVDKEGTRNLIRDNKGAIRVIVAEATGYSLGEIALFPEMIPRGLEYLTDNMLPLEFIIDVGTRCKVTDEAISAYIKRAFTVEISQLAAINFGVWVRRMVDSTYAEHKPIDKNDLKHGTRVRTIAPNETLRKEWTDEGWNGRQWDVEGTILRQHTGHGLCYAVLHPDDSVGHYDPSEFMVL